MAISLSSISQLIHYNNGTCCVFYKAGTEFLSIRQASKDSCCSALGCLQHAEAGLAGDNSEEHTPLIIWAEVRGTV